MEVLEKIIKELSDCQAEAIINKTINDNLIFENNKFDRANNGEQVKLEVRVTKGLRSAYAWTNNLNKWRECAQRAKKLMTASSELKTKPIISKAPSVNKKFIDQSINKASLETLKIKGEELINEAKKIGTIVTSLDITKKLSSTAFLNSNLTSFSQENSEIGVQVECAIKDSSAWDLKTSQGLNIDFAKLGQTTAQTCKESLNGKQIKPGLFNVVFDYGAITELLQVLLPSLMANNVLEHKSFLEGKEGTQVISPLLNINDVGILPDGTNNCLMDQEGSTIKDKSIFTNGILNTFLNDLYTATRMNVKPTGNSGGLLKRGLISTNNVIIKEGDANQEELLKDCIYVKNLMGSHTANTISGDFALNALNVIKYEKEATPLRDVMISGNIFKLLNQVTQVGKETRFDASLKTPLIKFRDVQVIG